MRYFGIILLAMTLVACEGAGLVADVRAESVEYLGSTHRDPFKEQIPSRKVQPKPDEPAQEEAPVTVDFLTVTGIVWESDRPQAIINGKIVTVGGAVDGAEVTAIDAAQVKVRFKGRQFVLGTGNKKGGQP
jgi:hypothetical protein